MPLKSNCSTLGIVIPYYKKYFLSELLISLKKQTNLDFVVYIGDDCSEEDPREIIAAASGTLTIKYNRFSTRLGNKSLSSQWNRCVQLVGEESWVWVIPDDDLLAPNCVEEFYSALTSGELSNINIVALPSITINSLGRKISNRIPDPKLQSNHDFYFRQLKGEATGSSLGSNIFRKEALLSIGGFVDFPRGTHSDHATMISVSAGSLIYCLEKATFFFRQSGINISSQTHDARQKMAGKLDFAHWIKVNEYKLSQIPDPDFYLYLYWKGEHYSLNEWPFDWCVLWQLFRLRVLCTASKNPMPVISIAVRKIFRSLLPIATRGNS